MPNYNQPRELNASANKTNANPDDRNHWFNHHNTRGRSVDKNSYIFVVVGTRNISHSSVLNEKHVKYTRKNHQEIFLEDLWPYSSHGSFELMISANFLWLSCRRVYLDLIFLNLPGSCNIAICILKRKSRFCFKRIR